MSSSWISFQGVSKQYRKFFGPNKDVFSKLDITINKGEIVGFFGPSGCGKSTLLRMLLGLTSWNEGDILYKDKPINAMNKAEKKEFHRCVQVVFQDPQNAFHPRWRLQRSLEEPLILFSLQKNSRKDYILKHLNLVGLEEGLLDRYPHQLSGGQLQRLALVRCLLTSPEGLFLDEASSMLDVSVQAQMMSLLRTLHKKRAMTLVLISHDWDLVTAMCERIYRFKNDGLSLFTPQKAVLD